MSDARGPDGPRPETPSPEQVAKSFVDAVAWGEHHAVWELLSTEGRTLVLRLGATRGMDQALAARLRDGTAATAEREEFLTHLVNGLRADLAGNDLDAAEAEVDAAGVEAATPGTARVLLVSPLPEVLALPGLPFASVELTQEASGWRIDRLIPRTSK
ncbi:MAG: hypothetical protein KY438_10060 [Actinobacteria bacterium]|nr:hypothetical protein [Actinomycetota bacterium]